MDTSCASQNTFPHFLVALFPGREGKDGSRTRTKIWLEHICPYLESPPPLSQFMDLIGAGNFREASASKGALTGREEERGKNFKRQPHPPRLVETSAAVYITRTLFALDELQDRLEMEARLKFEHMKVQLVLQVKEKEREEKWKLKLEERRGRSIGERRRSSRALLARSM